MALSGPIIIIEDDLNDAEVIVSAIRDIGIPNEPKIMTGAQEALDYLCTTADRPYIIICDIRMPGMDGLAFRRSIQQDDFLRKKSIPFVFFTGLVSEDIVNAAYDLDVQGFFRKANSYERVREQLRAVFIYWHQCIHPNREDLARLV